MTTNPIPNNIYETMLKICNEYGIDPSSSLDAQHYFEDLWIRFNNLTENAQFPVWLVQKIKENFISLSSGEKRPIWIQGSNWPFDQQTPMIFLGQIDLRQNKNPNLKNYFHDDVSIYVFLSREGNKEVIIQEY